MGQTLTTRVVILAGLAALAATSGTAQTPANDARIEAIVRQISPERLRANVDSLVHFGTRHTLSDTTSPTRGIGAARRWIRSQFEEYAKLSHNRMSVAYQQTIIPPGPRIPAPTAVVNVIATLRPSDPANPSANRTIIIGGHYDSRATDVMDATSDAPGADDDGSGSALVVELARVLSRQEFNATVVFVCFAGEEQGLYGSTALATRARSEGWDVEAVLSNDIVGAARGGDGSIDSTTVRVFSEAYSPLDTGMVFARRNAVGLENDGVSRSLARYVEEIGQRYVSGFRVQMIYRLDRYLRGGDHAPFHQRGYAAVRFTEAKEDFNHQHQDVHREQGFGDLPEFMDFSYLANVARVNAATAASLAFAPAPVRHAGIVTSHLAYDTQLGWEPSPGPGTAGYLVRWRPTASAVWEHSFFTRDTTVTLNVSKDDFLFGIETVNERGDLSPSVPPFPVR